MIASRLAAGSAVQRLSSMQHISMTCMSVLDDRLEAAPEHALAVEGHLLRVHVLLEPRLDHDLLHDAVALLAGLVRHEGEHDHLALLQLHALRERGPLAGLD